MSLSLLQSYSSAEEEEDKSIDESDEENSIDESDEESKPLKNKSTFDFPDPQPSDTRSALPSALDAFSEVTGPPRFLNNAAGEEEKVWAEKSDDRRKKNRKRSLATGVVVEAKAELVGMHERVRSDVEGSKSVSVGKTEMEKKSSSSSVKDKEKSKRMRGQSSHATWKSETEMQLRQHFD